MTMKNNKKISEDAAKAFESTLNALSLAEFSRVTGVRMELLRRFINRKARDARAETWDKIYPTLKPLLAGPELKNNPPTRIGSPYRRHMELVEMLSDQKVLLDVYDALNEKEKKEALEMLLKAGNGHADPSTYSSLTAEENALMGAFLALPEEDKCKQLLELVEIGTRRLRKRRQEMF